MRFFVILFMATFLMTNAAFSATEIRGLIRKGAISLPVDAEAMSRNTFPRLHYDIHNLIIGRLDNPITFNSGMKIESKAYELIDVLGSLDLIPYNEKTGEFKYRLSAKTKKLIDTRIYTNTYKPIVLSSRVLFNFNHTPEILIEGKVNFVNNKPALTNLNADKSGFSLLFGTPEPNRLSLTALRDIPVSIYHD